MKSVPITLVNSTSTTGSTYVLSHVAPYGQEAKQQYKDACVAINVATLTGTSPAIAFEVDEYIDGHWMEVGITGSMTAAGAVFIDSAGGAISSGNPTFSATTNLRGLGKGVDTRVVVTFSGTVGTAVYTVDYIGY
ncbi:MAG: hypothetical protein KGJ90_04710 [Patescibacteria group bacterium]|nr:hypothetical protein [Patescibacteria group bacterium]